MQNKQSEGWAGLSLHWVSCGRFSVLWLHTFTLFVGEGEASQAVWRPGYSLGPHWTNKQEEWVKSLSRVQLFATPRTVAYKASLSMEFSRQVYWSGLSFPSPGDLPDPGIEPKSPALRADALTSELPGKPKGDLKNSHHKNNSKCVKW